MLNNNTYDLTKIIKLQYNTRKFISKNILNKKKIINLVSLIKKHDIIDKLIYEWNNKRLKLFEDLYNGKKYKEHFKNDKTQIITQQLSPVLYDIFENLIEEKINDFNTDKVDKRDYMYKNIPIEAKITLSEGDSWTGNGTKKTPWHLLFKFKINGEGHMEGCLCMFANIYECITDWSQPKKSKKGKPVNYSTISFKNKNVFDNNLHVVSGDLHCIPKKVIVREMKEFSNDNSISLGKLKKRDDILNCIEEKLSKLDSSINLEWDKLHYNPEGKIEYIY